MIVAVVFILVLCVANAAGLYLLRKETLAKFKLAKKDAEIPKGLGTSINSAWNKGAENEERIKKLEAEIIRLKLLISIKKDLEEKRLKLTIKGDGIMEGWVNA